MRVLVTGAAGDPASPHPLSIGAATAVELAPASTELCLMDRNAEGLRWTRERVAPGPLVREAVCDVRLPDAIAGALGALSPGGEPYDVVVSVAGATRVRPFLDHDAQSLADEVTLNLLSHMWLAHQVLPAMCARGAGAFVCVGSDSAIVGAAGLTAYTAAKGGLMAFVRSLGREMGGSGVRVNCVSPGPTTTPSRARLAPRDVPDGFGDLPPLGRLGEPRDVASVIAFLASDAAGYVTGQTWSVNGGLVTV